MSWGRGGRCCCLHGCSRTPEINWLRYGHAAALAAAGMRAIMLDHRAHGESAKPHEPAAYPKDVLTTDALAFVEHLRLADYDWSAIRSGAARRCG
jgi:pimeloyl-ACP methyl ester carboxylesterase